MRRLIAGIRTSVDARLEGPEGEVDWVADWSDYYDVTERADACLLGAGMLPGYELYWSAIRDRPGAPVPHFGRLPTAAELDYVRFAARTPHYVLSSTRNAADAQWLDTTFLRGVHEVEALKRRAGGDIYLVGGPTTTAGLIEAGLVDELRLSVHPLLLGAGSRLFTAAASRRPLRLRAAEPRPDGRVTLSYAVG